jgi:hypothetical protein
MGASNRPGPEAFRARSPQRAKPKPITDAWGGTVPRRSSQLQGQPPPTRMQHGQARSTSRESAVMATDRPNTPRYKTSMGNRRGTVHPLRFLELIVACGQHALMRLGPPLSQPSAAKLTLRSRSRPIRRSGMYISCTPPGSRLLGSPPKGASGCRSLLSNFAGSDYSDSLPSPMQEKAAQFS